MIYVGIELLGVQKIASKRTKEWFLKQSKQIFIIHGYAGTGKTTIINAMVDELGIRENVRFCTMTGKASLVLNQKGCSATTIHRLIYELETFYRDGKMHYRFNKKSALDSSIKLIIVDEVSMVSKQIMEDLLSFNIPIIAIGDPMQLPAIGEYNAFMESCDVFLSEIHRQAQDNPIVHLSMLARTGSKIEYGKYGKNVIVIPKRNLTDDLYLRADQVICGKNSTRKSINNICRILKGFEGNPMVGDKIICLRNNWEEILEGYPLINGMVGNINKIYGVNSIDKSARIDFQPEFLDTQFEGLGISLNEFLGISQDFNKLLYSKKRTLLNIFDYGYAITCHKSQGSSFGKVLLVEEVLNKENHSKWLYTGITRAESRLLLVR